LDASLTDAGKLINIRIGGQDRVVTGVRAAAFRVECPEQNDALNRRPLAQRLDKRVHALLTIPEQLGVHRALRLLTQLAPQRPADAVHFPHVWKGLRIRYTIIQQRENPPLGFLRKNLETPPEINPSTSEFLVNGRNLPHMPQHPLACRQVVVPTGDVTQLDAEILHKLLAWALPNRRS
jgi:hypothetical protein